MIPISLYFGGVLIFLLPVTVTDPHIKTRAVDTISAKFFQIKKNKVQVSPAL